MSFKVPPAALVAVSRLRNACLACSRTLSPPTMFFRMSQAVCPEMNTIFRPAAITIWENPCGKLENRLFGLRYSFGISQWRLSHDGDESFFHFILHNFSLILAAQRLAV